MTTTSWSTTSVKASDSFAYWREAVCQTVLNVSMEQRPERFEAHIQGRQFGNLRFASFAATSHDVVRRRADIVRNADDHYLVSLQRRGQSRITQDDDAFALDPGEIAIVDGSRPFRTAFPKPVSRILAVIPRRTLDPRAPWLRKNPACRIGVASPFLDLARRHLVELAENDALSDSAANLLTDNLCNLLALATAPGPRERALAGSVPLEMLIAYCRQNLTDPNLSPATVAAAFGISVRTLHLRFRGTGRSFGEWVLEGRLELCGEALADPRQAGHTISEIAFACGFQDLSHFNRSFRARFGVTPGAWRSGVRAI